MLDFLRRGVKSWVAKALLLLLIASFAVWGIGDVFSFRLDSTVATVGDREVTAEQFANALERQRTRLSQQRGQGVTFREMREAGIDRQILRGLIRDEAFAAELDRLGIQAPDEAVAEAIRRNPAFQQGTGGFSDPAYRLALARIGFTPRQFEALTRTLLGQEVLTELATAATPVPPGMAQRIAAHREEARRVSLVALPRDLAPEPVPPGDAELRSYFEENAEAYRVPERRWGRYLHIDTGALARAMEPGEDELRAAYEERRGAYSREAARTIDQLPLPRDRADALARRVTGGETGFEALARELGEDPADLSLGQVTRADLPEATADAVFAETGPGIVGPVTTPGGPVLIRIREVTEGGVAPFEAVRHELAADLARDRAVERAARLATVIEDMRAGGATMAEIAEAETGIEMRGFDGLARDGTLAGGTEAEGLVASPTFIEEAFAALDHEEREILETEAGGYFTVRVERIEESRVPELSQVRDRVVADWIAAERQSAVEARAAELADGVAPRNSLAPVADATGRAIEELEPFTRSGAPARLTGDLVEDLFAAEEGAVLSGPAADGEGALVLRLDAVIPPDPETLQRVSAQLSDRLGQLVAGDAREMLVRAVEARHETSVQPGAIDNVFNMLGGAGGGRGG